MFFKPKRYFFFIFLLQFVFYAPISVAAASSSDSVSETLKAVFNKGLAAITDLNFRSNNIGKKYLIPVDLMAEIETPTLERDGSVKPGKADALRQNYQSASFRSVMTSGLRLDSDVAVNPACKDIGSEMQWLYTYYVFPLNCQRETCDPIDEVPDCLVAAKKVLDAADNFQSYVKALKAAWSDLIRIESCPFYNWQKTDEDGGSQNCKASSGLFTALQAWKDQKTIIKPALQNVSQDEIVCMTSTGAKNPYCDNNPIRSRATNAIAMIDAAVAVAEGSNIPSGLWSEGSKCYSTSPSRTVCPRWLADNWTALTGSVKSTLKPVLEKLVKGYIVYGALEGKKRTTIASKPSEYSIVNLLRPYGYSESSQIDAAKSFVNILANASQLPTVLVPGDEPVTSNNNQGPASSPCEVAGTISASDNVFYALGKKIGGTDSPFNCPILPQKGQRMAARIKAKNELSLGALSFNQNMRTLAAGQTLLLSNFYDAMVRRIINPGGSFDSSLHTMNNFIRPDWRTTSASSPPLDQTVEPGVLLPKSSQDSNSNNASTEMGHGEDWRKAMRSASPADVQREILFALADMLGVVYQSQLLEERLLVTMSFQGLQAMSGSGLTEQTRSYQDSIVQDVYTFATGTSEPQNSQGGAINSPSAVSKSSTKSSLSKKSSAKSMANKYSDKIDSDGT